MSAEDLSYLHESREFVDPTKPIEGFEEFTRVGMESGDNFIKKVKDAKMGIGDAFVMEREGQVFVGVIRDFIYEAPGHKPENGQIYERLKALKSEQTNLETLDTQKHTLDDQSKINLKFRLKTVDITLDKYKDTVLLGVYYNEYQPGPGEIRKREYVNQNPKDSYIKRKFISYENLKSSKSKPIYNFRQTFSLSDQYADARYTSKEQGPPPDEYLKVENK